MNGDVEKQRHGENWRVAFLVSILFSILSLLGLFFVYKRDSVAFLIETGADREEIMKSIVDSVDMTKWEDD
jgi:hypothetical protein